MTTKITLTDNEIPRQSYKIAADLPTPMDPPLYPGTREPVGPEDAPIFPMSLIEEKVSQERWVYIPEPVLERLLLWWPSPLNRARGLEKALDTPARIWL